MSRKFQTADYEATLNSTVTLRECLPPDHLARFIVDVITQLDLSAIYAHYGPRGGEALAPEILLGLLFYGYATGTFSSRKNECSPQQAAGYQNPKPQTRKTLEQLQLEFLTMKLLIDLFTPLLLHILANGFFIPMTSYGTDKRAFRPKFSTPQLLLHRRHPLKNLSGGQTFDHPDHFRWTRAGHRLDQEMHIIFVCANLSKGDRIAFGDVQADVFAHRVDLRVKDDTSILGRRHDVVDQCRDIVPLMTIAAHNSDNTISEKADASFEHCHSHRSNR